MANKSAVQLLCHRITSAEPRTDILRDLQQLSVSVFQPYFQETAQEHPSFDFSVWEYHITLPNAVVFYATTSTSSQPLGFFFGIPRTQPEIGHELFHIWVVAVEPNSRDLGIFPLLMDQIKQHARGCGYREMTICTRPRQFHKMYRILGKHGWEEVTWRKEEDGVLQQVLMKMSI